MATVAEAINNNKKIKIYLQTRVRPNINNEQLVIIKNKNMKKIKIASKKRSTALLRTTLVVTAIFARPVYTRPVATP